MQEDFLHHIWHLKKFDTNRLFTINGERITLISVGQHNLNSGPDFFNSQLKIGEQFWAGNVEIHLKSSDWYVHNHEQDAAYDNVILHVVYEHDTEIFRKDNSVIPTLELKGLIEKRELTNYQDLFASKDQWINCEKDFANVDAFLVTNWLERLYFERLERKSLSIELMLKTSKNNWEAVLFQMLAKNFGLKVNGEAFLNMAASFDFSILRKTQSNALQLEALFFGQSGLLEIDTQNSQHSSLKKEYEFLKQKFNLNNDHVLPVQFFRLRPPNFPTIRLSQLAMLYHTHNNLFSKIIAANTIEEFYELLQVSTSDFWNTHFTFNKASNHSRKTLTKSFIDLLLINTILPIKFYHDKLQGNTDEDAIISIIQKIAPEKNSIVDSFNSLRPVSNSAMQSQGLIQLKNEYCSKNKCLQCAVGAFLIANIS